MAAVVSSGGLLAACGASGAVGGQGASTSVGGPIVLAVTKESLPDVLEAQTDGEMQYVTRHFVAAPGLPALDSPAEAVRASSDTGAAAIAAVADALGTTSDDIEPQGIAPGAVGWFYVCERRRQSVGPDPGETTIVPPDADADAAAAGRPRCHPPRRPDLGKLMTATGLDPRTDTTVDAVEQGQRTVRATGAGRTGFYVGLDDDGFVENAGGSAAIAVAERRQVARSGTAAVIAMLERGERWQFWAVTPGITVAWTLAPGVVVKAGRGSRTITITDVVESTIDIGQWSVPSYKFLADGNVVIEQLALAPNAFVPDSAANGGSGSDANAVPETDAPVFPTNPDGSRITSPPTT